MKSDKFNMRTSNPHLYYVPQILIKEAIQTLTQGISLEYSPGTGRTALASDWFYRFITHTKCSPIWSGFEFKGGMFALFNRISICRNTLNFSTSRDVTMLKIGSFWGTSCLSKIPTKSGWPRAIISCPAQAKDNNALGTRLRAVGIENAKIFAYLFTLLI